MSDQGEPQPQKSEIEQLLERIDKNVNPPTGEVVFFKEEQGKVLTPEQHDANTIYDALMLNLSDIGYEAAATIKGSDPSSETYKKWVEAVEILTRTCRGVVDNEIQFFRDFNHQQNIKTDDGTNVLAYSADNVVLGEHSFQRVGISIRPEPHFQKYKHGGEEQFARGIIMVLTPKDENIRRLILYLAETGDPIDPLRVHINISSADKLESPRFDPSTTGQTTDRNFLLPVRGTDLQTSFRSTLVKAFNPGMMERVKKGPYGGSGGGHYTSLRFK